MVIRVSQDQISSRSFGVLPGGQAVELYTLANAAGMQTEIATYGGIVTSLLVPDSAGHRTDVVLGYDRLDVYRRSKQYFGALVGRYANRIARGQFELDGQVHRLTTNDGANSLHGGVRGFDRMVWQARNAHVTIEGPQLCLTYTSPNGEEGYPGDLSVTATYTLLQNALRLHFTAVTSQTTIVNLTGHSYFNLAGQGDVLRHEVQIDAERYTPLRPDRIPTGELRSVQGTPFDFRTRTSIGARIDSPDEQLQLGEGYDHNWVLARPDTLRVNATVCEPVSGRVLEILSDQPGLQFYSGNFLDGTSVGTDGRRYERRHGFCLEPQRFPNAPNEPRFTSPVLAPGEQYQCTIVYRFPATTQG